jgi:HEAT repeat protein
MLRARSADELGAIALGCGLMRDLDARGALLAKLDDLRDPKFRGYVALGLGLLGDRRSLPSIHALLDRAKYQAPLMEAAARALGLLGDTYAIPDLLSMLSQTDSMQTQSALATAVGLIGDARSISPLVAYLRDPEHTDSSRAFAAAALGMVGDRRDVVWRAALRSDFNYTAAPPILLQQSSVRGILDML